MTNPRDVITRALVLDGIYGAGEDPSSEDMSLGLDTLQQMLDSWGNTSLGMNQGTLALDTALTVPDSYIKCITYSLASELLIPFNVSPATFPGAATIIQIADEEKQAIRAVQRKKRTVTTDLSPCHMSVQSYAWHRR